MGQQPEGALDKLSPARTQLLHSCGVLRCGGALVRRKVLAGRCSVMEGGLKRALLTPHQCITDACSP